MLGAPPFTIADLAAETAPCRPRRRYAFVEGAGGPRSPLAADGDNVDLARGVGAELAVLVADAGLGTINAVRLCVDALGRVRHRSCAAQPVRRRPTTSTGATALARRRPATRS